MAARPDPHNRMGFLLTADGEELGPFELAMPGTFNIANAAAAVAMALKAERCRPPTRRSTRLNG